MTLVPVPPFQAVDQARAFHDALETRVDELRAPVVDAGIARWMSPHIVRAHRPAPYAAQCVRCRTRYPCTAALRVALMVRLPVAWTPYRLGLALSATAASRSGEQDGRRWQSPACAELQRLQRHGVDSGPSYRAMARACREASGGR